MNARLERKLADLWIGAYWERRPDGLHIWICLLPCLPIHIATTATATSMNKKPNKSPRK